MKYYICFHKPHSSSFCDEWDKFYTEVNSNNFVSPICDIDKSIFSSLNIKELSFFYFCYNKKNHYNIITISKAYPNIRNNGIIGLSSEKIYSLIKRLNKGHNEL